MTAPVKSLTQRLQLIQDEIEVVKKDMKNPYFKSKYADINSFIGVLKPLLKLHQVVVLQPLTNIGGRPAIHTIVTCETGERFESIVPIDDNADPQKIGSWITYVRRYAIQSFFFLQADDQDAEDILRPSTPTYSGKPATGAAGFAPAKTWNKGGAK